MRIKSLVLPSVALFAGLGYAAMETRGEEVLWYYKIYRMDVEVESLNTGSDKNPPWKLASSCVPQPGDFVGAPPANEPGKDKPAPDRRGCNFHGFMRHLSATGYNIPDAQNRIGNEWMPTNNEVRGITNWTPGSSYSRMDIGKLLGGSGLPGEEIKDGDSWKNFDKIQQIAGQRIKDLYQAQPEVAKRHFTGIRETAQIVREGRLVDGEDFKIQRMKHYLGQASGTPSKPGNLASAVEKAVEVKTSPRFGQYKWLNMVKLQQEVDKIGTTPKAKVKVAQVMKTMTTKWEEGEAGTGGDKNHMKLAAQYGRIDAAMEKQSNGANADACAYPPLWKDVLSKRWLLPISRAVYH